MMDKKVEEKLPGSDLLSVYMKNHLSFFYIPIVTAVLFFSYHFAFLRNIDVNQLLISVVLLFFTSLFFLNQRRIYKKTLLNKQPQSRNKILYTIMANKACYIIPWLCIVFWPYQTDYLFDLSLAFLIVFFTIGLYTSISASDYTLFIFDVGLQILFCSIILLMNWDNLEAFYVLIALGVFTSYSLWIGSKLHYTVKELLDSNIQLAVKTDEANKANQAKSDFLAMISHEIRTPLHGINSTVENLYDTRLSKKQKENLNIIKRCSNILLSMLNDVLDISKIKAKKINIEFVEFDFHQLISDLIKMNADIAEKKDIELHQIIDESVPRYVVSDPTRVNQIILNLISNAIKFTQKGSVSVDLFYDDASHVMAIEVSDTGIGIERENIDRIFSAFEQEDKGTTRNFGGTGLGLPIVKELITIMGGDISVSSEKGQGSHFVVILPMQVPRSLKSTSTEKAKKIKPIYLADCRILIAEDNKINRMSIEQIFSKYSATIDYAYDGLEAVQFAQKNKYDLIFMDVNMPNLNGVGAVKQIKETKNNNTPVIGLSAVTQEEIIIDLYQSGVIDHIIKPFDRQSFLEFVDRYKPFDLPYIKEKIDQIYKDFEESFCERYIQESQDEVCRLIQKLQPACEAENIEDVEKLAHEICGVSGNIGLYQTFHQAKNIEDLSMTKTALCFLSSKIEYLEHANKKETQQLQGYLKSK